MNLWPLTVIDQDVVLKALQALPDWPTASCCGEPRVIESLDVCYDHARCCEVCDGPAIERVCPGHMHFHPMRFPKMINPEGGWDASEVRVREVRE